LQLPQSLPLNTFWRVQIAAFAMSALFGERTIGVQRIYYEAKTLLDLPVQKCFSIAVHMSPT